MTNEPQTSRKSHIPFRLNLFFFIIFSLFSLLIYRLWDLQVIKGEIYLHAVGTSGTTKMYRSVPRGKIYDAAGQLLVGNIAEKSINFTRGTVTDMPALKMAEIAEKLAPLIDFPTDQLRERDLKDYWAVKNAEALSKRLNEQEQTLTGAELYELQLTRITAEDINFDEQTKEVVAIFTKMNSAYALSTISLKNQGVTDEEIARVGERLSEFESLSIGTSWERTYPQNELMRSLFGNVTSEKVGIPQEQQKTYLARNYSNNDRIGTGYLEEQYEDVLRGTKSVYDVKTQNNEVVSTVTRYEGESGGNLVLTINAEFQKRVEQIATDVLQNTFTSKGLNHSVYIVVQNPNNGEILSMVGKKYAYNAATDSYDRSKIEDDIMGVVNNNYSMGSGVKVATVAMGYHHGLISTSNPIIVDQPLKFQGSQPLQSWYNHTGPMSIDDIYALERSSNIYMVRIAMMLGGQYYYEDGGTLNIREDTLQRIRQFYSLFGLGNKTGIDLPSESHGYRGTGNDYLGALNISFGQYDTYTPLQLSQYITTVANKGKRYAPQLVRKIMVGDNASGTLQEAITVPPVLLNTVELPEGAWERIHQGLYRVVRGTYGTAAGPFASSPLSVSGKSGTAETFYNGEERRYAGQAVDNSIFTGYSPSDNAQVAVSVIVPNIAQTTTTVSADTARKVFEAYYDVFK